MTPSNPLPGVASKPATRAAVTADIQRLGAELRDAFSAADGTRAALRASRDAIGELGYGCVDWFIYVSDPGSVATVTRLAADD